MRNLRIAAALAAVAVIGAACGGGSEELPEDQSIVISVPLEPPTLDLTTNSAAGIPEVLLVNVLEGLVRLDENGEIQPALARDWQVSDDGLEYTFELEEATFHDGSDFTAEDVVFSFDRVRAEDSEHPFKAYFDAVETVEAVDDGTVEITLSRVSNNFLFYLTQGAGAILSEESIGEIGTRPIGTGPFKFRRWIRGDSIILERNDDYRGEAPALSEATFKYIEDPNAAFNALQAGDIDVISRVDAPETLESVEGDEGFEILEGLTNSETIMTINNAAEPLDDVLVRQALSHAIDRDALIQGARSGYAEPLGSHVPPTDPWYVDLSDHYPFDPDKARDLLQQAGVEEELTLSMPIPPTSYALRGSELIADQLQQVGITVEIEPLDFTQWVDQVFTNKDFDLTIIAHVEPRDIGQYGNPEYYWGYDNPEVADLLEQADQATDPEERDSLYEQVQRTITEDAVNVWMFLLPNIAVADSAVEGYKANRVSPAIDLTDVTIGGE